MGDPRFSMVTVTSVRLNADMSIAKVYWAVSGDKDRREQVESAFQAARGVLKRELATEVGLRLVPDLKFFYDDTLDVVGDSIRLLANTRGGVHGGGEE